MGLGQALRARGAPGDSSSRRLSATNRACPSHTPAAAGVLQLSACAGCARRERAPRARARRCAPRGAQAHLRAPGAAA